MFKSSYNGDDEYLNQNDLSKTVSNKNEKKAKCQMK